MGKLFDVLRHYCGEVRGGEKFERGFYPCSFSVLGIKICLRTDEEAEASTTTTSISSNVVYAKYFPLGAFSSTRRRRWQDGGVREKRRIEK